MSDIAQDIAEQVHELERLRAAGHIDDAWYLRTRAAIVRRHRERSRSVTLEVGREAHRSTMELQLPA